MLKLETLLFRLLALAVMGLLVSSCAVTTRSSQGTSETFENTTEASTDVSSSTSPRSDEKKSSELKVKAYASANIQRLQEDIARGGGEYLSAFAHLLGINGSHRAEFYAMTKEKYPVLFNSRVTTSEQMLARLYSELDAHPLWRQ
jgi:uncharacterized Zn finger protein